MEDRKKVIILTEKGYKYSGLFISQDEKFIYLLDIKEGKIQIPISTISFMKDVQQ